MQGGLDPEYSIVVVRLHESANGTWYLELTDSTGIRQFPLKPVVLVIRLRRDDDSSALQGSIGRYDDDQRVPFRSSRQLVQIIQEWLSGNDPPASG